MHKLGKQMGEYGYGNPVKETGPNVMWLGAGYPSSSHIFYIDAALFTDAAQGIYSLGCSENHHFEQDFLGGTLSFCL